MRVLVLTGLAFLGLVAVLYGSARTITLQRFAAIESREVVRDVERATAGLQQEIDGIEAICSDWAQWDDAYRFMRDENPEFAPSNLTLESVANLDLDVVVFVGANGEVRHAVGLDANRRVFQPIPASLRPALVTGHVVGRDLDDPRRSGLLTLPEGVMAFAARAILTSEAKGPSRGTLVMGRYLGEDRFRRIGSNLRLDISADRFGDFTGMREGMSPVALASATTPLVVPQSAQRVVGLTLLRDITGTPALVLRVEEARDVFAQGVATMRQLLLALLITTILFGGGVMALIERSVLAPLARLGSWVGTVAASGSLSGRVPVVGRDEFATLAGQVNTMLEALEVGGNRLRASEARYRHLVETAPDVIFTVDARSGRLTSVSPAFERITGWQVDAWLGRRAARLVAPPGRAQALAAFAALLRGESLAPLDMRVRHASGELIDLDFTATPEITGGQITGVLGIARDITRRKLLEAEVLHTQKIQAIGMLTSGVAHDFNNLLQAQMSLTQLLRWRRAEAPRHDQIVKDLEALIKRGAGLTRQLLIFARKEVTKLEDLDLGDVVRDGVGLARQLVRENVHLDVTVASDRLPIHGDRGQLGQVLLNLIANAADAMPDGGRLELRAGHGEAGEGFIEVTDTGIGMPSEVRERLFEPFFTTKAPGSGTGLGLAVVHSIVAALGGRVDVHSSPGAGSTFRVTLPLRVEPEPTSGGSDPASESPTLPTGRGERVLVVEDESGAREALQEMLTDLGYLVTAVGSGEEAGLLPAEPAIDLLLTDQMLPGAVGIDLATGLVDRWPDLRVIVMSGYSEDQVLRQAVRLHAVRFLQKPFDMATLTQEVRTALDERHAPGSGADVR